MKIRSMMAAAALTLLPAAAQAQLATFDDNPTGVAGYDCTNDGGGSFIANGYAGFNWSNFAVAGGAAAAALESGPGYANGMVTAPCVALNAFGGNSSVSSATDFTFNGGWFTAAFGAESVTINGFNDANQLFTSTFDLTTTTPVDFVVDWAGVNNVTFATSTQEQFVFDDFRFNNAADVVGGTVTPEPATMSLMATGLVGIAGAGLRRRRNKKS